MRGRRNNEDELSDVEDRRLSSRLELSTTAELPLRLRWLAVLSGTVQLDLSVSGGVHDTIDAVKALMCGAHSVQMVSAVFYQGPEVFGTVRHGLVEWLEEHELTSIEDLRGIMNVARQTASAGAADRQREDLRQAHERLPVRRAARGGPTRAPAGGGSRDLPHALCGRVRESLRALLPGTGLRDGGR